uniref:Ig-like domain-containing protein n=1 Tax=Lates calcarifer TaxID=8187 RepID=A0A4W6FWB2_LATCA
ITLLFCLSTDADSTCPKDSNPLQLEPSEVIGEHGDEVIVNCTSSSEDHDGMYWINGDNRTDSQEDAAFFPYSVSLSDYNVTAECKIKVNSSECGKELGITIYKNPSMVNVYPTKHVKAMVEGEQYELHCDIHEVAPVQNLTVRWYKDSQLIHTDSFTDTIKTQVNMSSILTINISRGDSGVQFKCEAQLDFGPSGPVTPVLKKNTAFASLDAPEFKGNTTDLISVKEGDDVTLNCEAEGNPPPSFHWTRDGVNLMANTSNLSITQVMAGSVYTCTAHNYLGTPTKHIYVDVINTMAGPAVDMTTPAASLMEYVDFWMAGCPLILMPPEIVVRFGDPVSVNCTTSETDAQGMGWEAPSGGTGFEKGPTVTWMVESLENWYILAKCYITRNNGDQCQVMPSITLYKTPDLVSVTAPHDGPMVENTESKLICKITNVAPVQNLTVKWYKGNEVVWTETFKNLSVTPVNVTSTLKVTPTKEYDGARFKCDAELHLGPNGPEQIPATSSEPHVAVVNYKPLIKDCPDHYVGMENFRMDMVPFKAVGNPPPTLQWYYEGEPISAFQPLTRNHSGTYTLEVRNSLGKSNKPVHIEIEYSPSFSCNKHYEVKEHSELQPECKPKGNPIPDIKWFKDGKPWEKKPWTRRDNGNYSLEATNKYGTDFHKFHVNLFLLIVIWDSECIFQYAEGNPVPRVSWNYTSAPNVIKATGGSQESIVVTGATSTNAGVYICVATNKVGSVSRSFTLIMKGLFPLIWWLLIVLLIVLLLICLIIYCKRQTKHGQYNFVPNKPRDTCPQEHAGIPLTTKSNA